MKLDPVQQKFVLRWGGMGTRWGSIHTVVFDCLPVVYILAAWKGGKP